MVNCVIMVMEIFPIVICHHNCKGKMYSWLILHVKRWNAESKHTYNIYNIKVDMGKWQQVMMFVTQLGDVTG